MAILLDGGFVKKKLEETLGRFPVVQDVVDLVGQVMGNSRLAGQELFRVFFYDAPPFEGTGVNPIDGSRTNFSTTKQAQKNRSLLEALELQPDFAVRRGVIANRGWKLGRFALLSLKRQSRPVRAGDLVPDLEQKGVDLRIGLDIASMALKGVVGIVVVVSGDSDLIPATKFARKEGLRVYLAPLGGPIRRELQAHVDFVI